MVEEPPVRMRTAGDTAAARVGGGRTWVLVVAMAVVVNGAGVVGVLRKRLCVLWRDRAHEQPSARWPC
jgi:hypothetical protein